MSMFFLIDQFKFCYTLTHVIGQRLSSDMEVKIEYRTIKNFDFQLLNCRQEVLSPTVYSQEFPCGLF